jgi:hypothetical protein
VALGDVKEVAAETESANNPNPLVNNLIFSGSLLPPIET